MTPVGRQALPSAASVLAVARAAKGFMPDDEGMALAAVAAQVGRLGTGSGVIVEVGAYCGRSTTYLAFGVLSGAGAGDPQTIVFSVDHHHGSEENQSGWEHHDPTLVDPATGRLDTLPAWRRTMEEAQVESLTVALVGDSPTIAARWSSPAGLVFIDGGHGSEPAWADYHGWARHVAVGGWLVIHDVFPDPNDGGRPPYELYCRALDSGAFDEEAGLGQGSLRVLKRTGLGI
ncbi:MAG TPA: class I SAM-dependent methyltransferase [Acidimicrobiales bacterium]|nr:class I SAM-dependent methyltransferase [Acidimicrobiales bacterium]